MHDYPLRCITADRPEAWSSRIQAMYGAGRTARLAGLQRRRAHRPDLRALGPDERRRRPQYLPVPAYFLSR